MQKMRLPEHRAPTVSSAQHWYPSSVDQQKIWYVPWTIGCRGVGGGISTDEDREIDDGRCGSVVKFLSFKSRNPIRTIGFLLLVPPSLGDRSIERCQQ